MLALSKTVFKQSDYARIKVLKQPAGANRYLVQALMQRNRACDSAKKEVHVNPSD